ncbi:hypothetical protein APSETT444_005461 [Aspergillus pseudonomiae]
MPALYDSLSVAFPGVDVLSADSWLLRCIPAPSKPEEVTFRHGQNPSLRPKGPPRYGESDLAFPDDQIWVNTPPEVAFEDETDRTAADYHVVQSGASSLYLKKASERRLSTSVSTLPPSTSSLLSPALSPGGPESFQSLPDFPHGTINNLLPADTMGDHQKLGNLNEAFLLRHFRRTIGAWVLNTSAELEIGASLMLVIYADGSCALSQDLQRHLLAGSVYIGSHVDCAFSGGLAEASFWAFVMQDVQFALATRSPLRLTIGPFEERLRLAWEYRSAKTDRDWAHRALWLLAQTINYCYEPSSPAHLSSVLWDVLKKKICDWEMRRPDSFRPLHFSPATTSLGRPFPVVWFTSASHVTLTANAQAATAAQQICMAKALMHEYELRTHQFAASPNQGRKLIEVVLELHN